LTESDLYFEAKAALETEVKKALNLTKGFWNDIRNWS
jgi:hypothetical protein